MEASLGCSIRQVRSTPAKTRMHRSISAIAGGQRVRVQAGARGVRRVGNVALARLVDRTTVLTILLQLLVLGQRGGRQE